jgi:basic membrane protein A
MELARNTREGLGGENRIDRRRWRTILQGRSGAGLLSPLFMAWIAILFAAHFIGLTGAVGSGEIDKSAESQELKVALLDFGPIGDKGWTYEAHVRAIKMAEELPYVNLSERENASGPNAPQIMREYALNGYRLIFCHSYDFGDAIAEVAPEYPETIFMWGAGVKKLAPNSGTYFGRMYEVQYLTGIVAGSVTKTNKIGFNAAVPTSEVIRGINAFAKGVASSNPEAKVYVEWIGNWYDPKNETEKALSLISNSCDVITHHSDSDATEIAADKTRTYFISFGSDAGRLASSVFLTGAIWNWEPIMTSIVESVRDGTWDTHPKQDWWYGLAEDGVRLAPFSSQVPGDIVEAVQKDQEAIARGRLVIFPGMSDEELRSMYYFEPNVVGDLPTR